MKSRDEEVLGPLLDELPTRRREAIIRALTDLHDLLRKRDNNTRAEHDSTQELHRLLSPQQPRQP